MASVEEQVEEHYKGILDTLGVRHYGKSESINPAITKALKEADSKSGGTGRLMILFANNMCSFCERPTLQNA